MMKKPWNRIDLPVYSISSKCDSEENMNVITYMTAVSMQPKQFIAAVYNQTKTLELVQRNPHFVIQLLSKDQYRLVHLLGKQSGKTVRKIDRLKKRKLITYWNGFAVLTDALALMEVKAVHLKVNASVNQPDHQLFLCELIHYKNNKEGDPLTIDILRHHKIVRM